MVNDFARVGISRISFLHASPPWSFHRRDCRHHCRIVPRFGMMKVHELCRSLAEHGAFQAIQIWFALVDCFVGYVKPHESDTMVV